jgi:hypothetical protein
MSSSANRQKEWMTAEDCNTSRTMRNDETPSTRKEGSSSLQIASFFYSTDYQNKNSTPSEIIHIPE